MDIKTLDELVHNCRQKANQSYVVIAEDSNGLNDMRSYVLYLVSAPLEYATKRMIRYANGNTIRFITTKNLSEGLCGCSIDGYYSDCVLTDENIKSLMVCKISKEIEDRTLFTCPGCKKETYDPWGNEWKVIETKPLTWGTKFCPDCYEKHKDSIVTWDDLMNLNKGGMTMDKLTEQTIDEVLDDMRKRSTIVVNFFAGPGAGKSTMCAHTFAELKWNGVNCEMALEYAKDKVWEQAFKVFDSQLYIAGKQFHRINRLAGQVDVILTDSPIPFSIVYNKVEDEAFNKAIMNHFHQFRNVNYYVDRKKVYNPAGRFQDEAGAKEVDTTVKDMLLKQDIPYRLVEGSRDGVEFIVNDILKILRSQDK